MNLRQLECFNAVAFYKNYAHAALKLNLSQPTVSKQIKNLEDEVGFALFVRDKHHVELTQAGEMLLENSEAIVHQWKRAVNRAFLVSQQKQHYEIGYIGDLHDSVIPDMIRKMKGELPDLLPMLQFQQVLKRNIEDTILQNEYFAIFTYRIPELEKNGWGFYPVHTDRHYCVMSVDHHLAEHESLSLRELDGEVLVLPGKRPWVHHLEQLRTLDGGFVLNTYEPSSSAKGALSMILIQDGVAIMPGVCCQENKNYRCIPLEPDIPYEIGLLIHGKLTVNDLLTWHSAA